MRLVMTTALAALVKPSNGTGKRRPTFPECPGREPAVERTELDQLERVVDHEIKARFPPGTVQRVVVLQHGDDPVIEPGELLVRVYIPAPDRPEDYAESIAEWEETHRARMEQIRRELSLRLPPARLLEFTFDDTSAAPPRIMMPDDGTLAAEQPSGREIVRTALTLLRSHYVFPERAEQAATAIEARLAAGEYDDLDEITLTDRLTSHLYAICADKHLQMRLRRGAPPAALALAGAPPAPALAPGLAQNPAWARINPPITRRACWPCGSGDALTTSAFTASSGWTATLAIWTSAGCLSRRLPGRPSPRRWNWSRGRSRSSSTCGGTAAGPRTAWFSGAATCSRTPRRISTTSSTPIPVRPGSSGRWITCQAPATSTARSTC